MTTWGDVNVTERAQGIVRRLQDTATAKQAADELQGWLVNNEPVAIACVQAGALEALKDVLVNGPLEALADAAWAVNNIVFYDALKEAAFKVGMTKIMADLLLSDITEVKRPAAGTILGLAYPENLKRKVFEEGAVPGLLEVLRTGPENAMEGACGALQNISFLRELKLPVFEAGVVPLLLRVLKTGPESAKTNAAAAMANICIPEGLKQPLFDAGVVEVMIQILQEGPMEAKRYAAGTLQGIAYLRPLAQPVFDAGAVPLLLNILRDGPIDAKGNAAACLGNIAVPDALRKPLFDTGVLPLLIDILKNGPIEAHAGSCGAIRSLAGHKDLKEPVYSSGVVPLLLKVLEHGNEEAQASATGALLNLANNETNAMALVDTALPQIVGSMQSVDDRLSASNMWTDYLGLLYNLSANTDTAHRQQMQTAGVLQLVTPSMQSRENPAAFVTATMCVANLIGHEEDHPLLVTDNVLVDELLKVLRASLQGEEYCKATWAIWAPLQGLANLSLNENNKRLMSEAGALEACVDVLRATSDARAQRYAAKAVSNIAFAVKVEEMIEDVTAVLENVARAALLQETREYSKLALFQIRQRQNSGRFSESTPTAERHVMLSFPAKYREFFAWLENSLSDRGFVVWSDNQAKSSKLLESMAKAIEESSAVIFCVDTSYKGSEACRTEGEYAYNLRKPMLPIRLDSSYTADGWLGALASKNTTVEAYPDSRSEALVERISQRLVQLGAQPRVHTMTSEYSDDDEEALAKAKERTEVAEARAQALQRELQALKQRRSLTAISMNRNSSRQRVDSGVDANTLTQELMALKDQVAALEVRLASVERRKRCTVS